LKMNFNFNMDRIRFRAGWRQRERSRFDVICIAWRKVALNGVLSGATGFFAASVG
jgi:hypothetical protein